MSEATSPKLNVSFILDEQTRRPVQADNRYFLKFSIADAPPELGSVVYQLDSTYERPVREKRKSETDDQFTVEASTNGDYDVIARLRLPGKVQTLAAPVSGALWETYGENPDPAIADAIKSIAAHGRNIEATSAFKLA